MKRLPPVLLFDLDDTLLVFGSGKEDVWREVGLGFAPQLGLDLDPLLGSIQTAADAFWSAPETKDLGRLDMLGSRRTIVTRALAALGCDRADIGEAYADAYTWAREERVAPLPGAIETLETLRSRGHRLGLVTNGGSLFQRRKIHRYDLEGFFEDIRIEGEQGIGKPHAAAYERALAAFGVGPEDAWMVGDNVTADIAGAQAAGLRAVWVDSREEGLGEDAPAAPDRIVRAVRELID